MRLLSLFSFLFAIIFHGQLSAAAPFRHRPAPAKGFGCAKRVLILALDGLGGLYIENATDILPNLKRIMEAGAWTTRARNQLPTVSAPNWCTILSGMTPVESGVLDNGWVPQSASPDNVTVEALPPISGESAIPETLFRAVKRAWKAQNASHTTAMSYSWDWIGHLAERDTVDAQFYRKDDDEGVFRSSEAFLLAVQPRLMFSYFGTIDEAGHATYWGSPEYYKTAQLIDSYVGKLMDLLELLGMLAHTLVVITADHGGWRHYHGQSSQACVYIPAIFYGPGVGVAAQKELSGRYISNRDFAPTIMHALGLPPTEYMGGRVLEEIFL